MTAVEPGAAMQKSVRIDYYAAFREQRGCGSEVLVTGAATVMDLYAELQHRHGFRWGTDVLQVAINDEFRPWETPLASGDTVVFIAPVSGG
jgi:molybdopterin converting factor small subunit